MDGPSTRPATGRPSEPIGAATAGALKRLPRTRTTSHGDVAASGATAAVGASRCVCSKGRLERGVAHVPHFSNRRAFPRLTSSPPVLVRCRSPALQQSRFPNRRVSPPRGPARYGGVSSCAQSHSTQFSVQGRSSLAPCLTSQRPRSGRRPQPSGPPYTSQTRPARQAYRQSC
jgi:hypothetical protein